MAMVGNSRLSGLGGLIVCVFTCLMAGALGSRFMSAASMQWYETLQKPAIQPPEWVFGPVWSLLYVLMGISLWLVLRATPCLRRRRAVELFAAQLLLNAAWTGLFFGLQNILLGLVGVAALLALLVGVEALFWRVRPVAGALLLPYIAWGTYATVLTAWIAVLNL